MFHLQWHLFPRLPDVAPDGRIHESAIKRHRRDLEKAVLRIAPRTDHGTRLVELQHHTDDVEEKNDFYFVFRLHFCVVEDDLDEDCGDEEEVVAGEAEEWDVRGDDKQEQKRPRKNSRPRLLKPEHN